MANLSRSAKAASFVTGTALLFTIAAAGPRRADVPLASLERARRA